MDYFALINLFLQAAPAEVALVKTIVDAIHGAHQSGAPAPTFVAVPPGAITLPIPTAPVVAAPATPSIAPVIPPPAPVVVATPAPAAEAQPVIVADPAAKVAKDGSKL